MAISRLYPRRFVTAATATLFLIIIAFAVIGIARADDMVRTGEFSGLSNHVTTGSVSIVKGTDGVQIVLGADFTFDGAPDPKVALGKDGKYDPATLISPLKQDNGEQSYSVPASINVDDYNEVYIWCEKFSVGLGVAPLAMK